MGMIDDVIGEQKNKIDSTLEHLRRELSKLRTGRASMSILDGLKVDYYGTPTPLNGVASISVPEARLIVIKPWDKGVLSAIEKAIFDANLGVTPQNDGEVIRLAFPPLTEERRKEIVKQVKAKCEEFRVAVRTERRDANENLKMLLDEKEITEDEHRKGEERVQQQTDAGIAQIDQIQAAKEKDVLTV
jgi:ribosome recycling factor